MQPTPASDFPLTLATLLVAIVALTAAVFGPYLSDLVRERFRAPRLKILWDETTPHCILTYFRMNGHPELDEPVYYFRFRLTNEGKSQARACEAVLENLWVYDAAGRPQKYPDFAPRNLGLETDQNPVGINPNRRIYCAIGHILGWTPLSRHKNGLS